MIMDKGGTFEDIVYSIIRSRNGYLMRVKLNMFYRELKEWE
ncbi:MAG: hypothetical protein RBR05_04985 [Candidatus Methanomethylophilaceae archaeon]|nr:hypothetical protein [Candidatus Methanomethylophilaceae archaeon]